MMAGFIVSGEIIMTISIKKLLDLHCLGDAVEGVTCYCCVNRNSGRG